ncbi:acetylglutamate kinase [Flavobacterium tegetincola]|uniref:acetylglutamate kinase n=1 Tax=Flavobacterium tegetincola TaxID=150172 RepID=UPI000429E395|nr:acetylglutamate kinase [Flavobacterium tegetincola]
MKKLHVIKTGGNIIDDSQALTKFLSDFHLIDGLKIVVHGGGKQATNLANSLHIKQTMVDGRRITDAETLDVAVMVYAGLINKNIVAKLQAQNCNAVGFSGADGNLVKSTKRIHPSIDFGYVGDISETGVNVTQFEHLLHAGLTPVICAITHDGDGNLLNTNADTMASKIASALAQKYTVSLTYCFEKNGVLSNVDDDYSYLPKLNKTKYEQLKQEEKITKGMIPKLDNAFEALEKNVKNVSICHAQNLSSVDKNLIGTQIISS